MIDQYVYTRVEGGASSKDYGHGLYDSTSGINAEIGAEVSKISRYDNDKNVDHEGKKIGIIEKRNVAGGVYAALQHSVLFPALSAAVGIPEGDERLIYYSSTDRAQFLTHGYVCDIFDESDTLIDPDRWFYQDFIDYNVNLKKPMLERLAELPDKATPLEPLPSLLEKIGMPIESFITAVRAAFDTENRDTIELIEVDYSRPDAYELCAQTLRWIFRFLPFGMRRMADFSTCYDIKCGGKEYSIAMIPTAMLSKDRGGRVTFSGITPSAKYGYIITDGRVLHQKLSDRVDFDTCGSLYARWLEGVIRSAYFGSYEHSLETLKRLNDIYGAIDEYISKRSIEDQCKTELYDALTWAYLCNTIYDGDHVDEADDFARLTESPEGYIEELFSLGDNSLLEKLMPEILDEASLNVREKVDNDWLRLICRLVSKTGNTRDAREVLDIYLAKTIDLADETTLLADIEQYFSFVGLDRSKQLERAFFPETPANPERWSMAGADPSKVWGIFRAKKWLHAMVSHTDDCAEYLERTEEVFAGFAGFEKYHVKTILGEKLIPRPTFTKGGFEEMGRLIGCKERMNGIYGDDPEIMDAITQFYYGDVLSAIQNGCSKRMAELASSPQIFPDFINEIEAAFAPVANTTKGAGSCRFNMDKSIEIWCKAAVTQFNGKDKGTVFTACNDETDLHERFVNALLKAKRAGCSEQKLVECYEYVCRFMCSKGYSHRDEKWFLDFPRISGEAKNAFGAHTVIAETVNNISGFISSGDHSYTSYMRTKGDLNDKDWLSMIMGVFDKGGLKDLDPLLIAYHGFVRGTRTNPNSPNCRMAESFRTIITRKGCGMLAQILACYPSSEPCGDEQEEYGGIGGFLKKLGKKPRTEGEEYVPRVGRFKWMILDETLLSAAEEAVRAENRFIIEEFRANEALCPELVGAVYELAPARTVLNNRGRRINDVLNYYWENIKPSGSAAKKAMSELKKLGAFDQSR